MIKPHERKTLTDVFVTVVGMLLVVGGYLLVGIMGLLPQGDNVTKALVMLAVLVIVSSIAQLATFSIISSGRENRR
ncbi:MAG: hypothetical protein HY516_01545 [Candidatus Aenigmarchaeota archaeon]|nr:hypothetical protein [Candidatus Aenigmarchaeota archaeon]